MNKLSFLRYMNKKIVTGGIALGILYSFVFASTTSAFWPFDSLFKKSGDVKANVTEKMYVGEDGQGNNKAYMTYQTLVSMNDTCRKLLSQDFSESVKVKVTPSARGNEKLQVKKQGSDTTNNNVSQEESGVTKSNENELGSIYNNLKARCENISTLVTRMQKIYKGARPNVSLSPSRVKLGGSEKPTMTVTPTKRPMFNIKFNKEKEETKE